MALTLIRRREPSVAVRPASRTRLAAAREPRAGRLAAIGRRLRHPRVVYTTLTVAGAGLVTVGVGLIFLPAALVLAGLAVGSLGMVGLGMQLRGAR